MRFRLPYNNYKDLVEWVWVDPLFDQWCGYKIKNKKCSPVELLVFGLLRYLGRGWTFDDIEECTAISKEVHCMFVHKFLLLLTKLRLTWQSMLLLAFRDVLAQ